MPRRKVHLIVAESSAVGLSVSVPKVGSLNAVDHLSPCFRLKQLEQIKSLPLVIAVWLAEPLLVDAHSCKVHNVVNLIIIPTELSVGTPNILATPVIDRVTVVDLAFIIIGEKLCCPLFPIQGDFARAGYSSESVEALIGAYADAASGFFPLREPSGELRHKLLELHSVLEEREIPLVSHHMRIVGVLPYPCLTLLQVPAYPIWHNLGHGIAKVYRQAHPPTGHLFTTEHSVSELDGVAVLRFHVNVQCVHRKFAVTACGLNGKVEQNTAILAIAKRHANALKVLVYVIVPLYSRLIHILV